MIFTFLRNGQSATRRSYQIYHAFIIRSDVTNRAIPMISHNLLRFPTNNVHPGQWTHTSTQQLMENIAAVPRLGPTDWTAVNLMKVRNNLSIGQLYQDGTYVNKIVVRVHCLPWQCWWSSKNGLNTANNGCGKKKNSAAARQW